MMSNQKWIKAFGIFFIMPIAFCLSAWSLNAAEDNDTKLLQRYLSQGKIEQGIKEFEKLSQAGDRDDAILASLGILQFVHAMEGLGQAYYRYGINPTRNIPIGIFQLPVEPNPHPVPLSYQASRAVLVELLARLSKAEESLAKVQSSGIKLPLNVHAIFIDIDADGKTAEGESFAAIMSRSLGLPRAAAPNDDELVFAFDDADVLWLRGYIQVLSGITEAMLAYDWQDAFERTAHLLFDQVETPYTFLHEEGQEAFQWSANQVADLIAFIHVMNFEITEPERMKTALAHFEKVIALSRETWKLIGKETDNDREWIPGPNQNSIMLGNVRGGRMGANWGKVLDHAEQLLKGERLLPFWRGFPNGNSLMWFGGNGSSFKVHPTLGINLRKVFTEPKRFDFVLWMQGTGVAPFLEEGEIVNLNEWQSMSDMFHGRMPFFALWIN
jgi:hypothetical protein